MKKAITLLALLLCVTIPVSAANMSEWAEAEYKKAQENNLVPAVLEDADLQQSINRTEFAALSVKLYEALSGKEIEAPAENPFTDTEDKEVLKAYAAGITTGMEEDLFGAEELLTREQAATMLTRTYTKSMDATAEATGDVETFTDNADISDWATESVYFMVENGIINGMGDGTFAPKANTTREQSIAISVRTFEKFYAEPEPEPGTDVQEGPVSLRKYIPEFSYGTETEEIVMEGSTTVKYTGVAEEDFVDYIKMVRMMYPNLTYELNESYQKGSRSHNGKYQIFASWSNTGDVSLMAEPYVG